MTFENLRISRVVVNEVHRRNDDREVVPPTYGSSLAVLDAEALTALSDRVTSAMGSAARSIELEIREMGSDSLLALAKRLHEGEDDAFISDSKAAVNRLAEAQTSRNIPGGILLVFSGTVGNPGRPIVGLLKAELHSGFTRRAGPRNSVSIEFLKNLLLTPQTKLYKIGAFVKSEPVSVGDDRWQAFVYDDQLSTSNRLAAAQYFYEVFLGCGFPESSARRTREFHDHTREFIRGLDWPEEQKTDLHNALVTYLKVDQSPTIQVSGFAATYLPTPSLRDQFALYMSEAEFPQIAVPKDLSDVRAALRYRKVTFRRDVKIIAPAEQFDEMVRMRSIDGEPDSAGETPRWTEVIIRSQIQGQE